MIKKIVLLVTVLLLLSSFAAATVDKPYLTTTLMKYEPQPAEPGKYVKVYIKLENSGSGTSENVLMKLVPEFPFSLDPGKSEEEFVGLLGGGSFHVAEYNLKVDEKAVEGTNILKVRYNSDKNQEVWVEQMLSISIQTQDAVLGITDISTEPKEIVPGSTGEIMMTVENMADSALTDVTINLDLSSDDLLFAPFNSASEKSIYQLESKESHQFSFNIIAYPDVSAGVYKIPATITYNDNIGNSYSKSEIIGVLVNSKPDIQVMVESTTLLSDKEMGEVVLKIVNKGLSDVKLMTLSLKETGKYEILSSSKEEYIGNLDSDDFETVDFTLLLNDVEELNIPLSLSYRDNNNQLYDEEFTLKLNIRSAKELGQGNGQKGWIVLIIIIVVIVLLIVWAQRRKKRRKHQ